jgi:Arc/MetJ family transcription regulator
MRITLNIDEELLNQVIALTEEKTKSGAVRKALDAHVRHQNIEKLRDMLGTIDLVDNWYELRHGYPEPSPHEEG